MEVLFEAHDEVELERVVTLGATLVGVNSRNLKTMQVDPQRALALGARLPPAIVGVYESGIQTGADLAAAARAGYRAALVGESLLRSSSPAAALRKLRFAGDTARSGNDA
jgi:indole-3-glycerol phosphate synthase